MKGYRWHNNSLAGILALLIVQVIILIYMNGDINSLLLAAHANVVPLGIIFSPSIAIAAIAKRLAQLDEKEAKQPQEPPETLTNS